MKITSSRADDIRRERDEWNEKYHKMSKKHEEEVNNYRHARDAVFNVINEYVMSHLSKYNLLEFEVNCDLRFGENIEVCILCNQNRVHDETSALSWDYKVRFDGEGIHKESSSWSGLAMVSEENLQSLEQTLNAGKWLNAQDWVQILDVKLPKWEDYVTPQEPMYKPDFDRQLKEAEIEDIIGKEVIIRGYGLESFGYRGNPAGWYLITRETPKQYEAAFVTDHQFDRWEKQGRSAQEIFDMLKSYSQRVKKSNLVSAIDKNLETREL